MDIEDVRVGQTVWFVEFDSTRVERATVLRRTPVRDTLLSSMFPPNVDVLAETFAGPVRHDKLYASQAEAVAMAIGTARNKTLVKKVEYEAARAEVNRLYDSRPGHDHVADRHEEADLDPDAPIPFVPKSHLEPDGAVVAGPAMHGHAGDA